jgi:hypothetical protein
MAHLTSHFADERQSRNSLIQQNGGYGKPVAQVMVDKGHPNGPEWHVLTDNAIILVYNVRTRNLITVKFARPGQIRQLNGRPNVRDNNHSFWDFNLDPKIMKRAEYYAANNMNNW